MCTAHRIDSWYTVFAGTSIHSRGFVSLEGNSIHMARPSRQPGQHGTISVESIGDLFEAAAYVRVPGGERRRLKARRPSAQEAQHALELRVKRIAAGYEHDAVTAQTTLAELVGRWCLELDGTTPATAEAYRRAARLHIVPALGETPVGEITVERTDAFLKELRGKFLAVSRHARLVLRGALRMAVNAGILDAVPVSPEPVAEKAGSARQLTCLKFNLLRHQVQLWQRGGYWSSDKPTRGHDLLVQIDVMLGLGLARRELLALCWEDIDLTAQKETLTVTGVLERTSRGLQRVKTRPRRFNRLPEFVAESLREHWESAGNPRPAWSSNHAPGISSTLTTSAAHCARHSATSTDGSSTIASGAWPRRSRPVRRCVRRSPPWRYRP